MDFPAAQTPPASPDGRRAGAAIALLALVLYAVLLVRNVGAVAAGSDSSGYMNHARLLASGRVHVEARTLPGLPLAAAPGFLYVPLGFKPAWNGDGLVPTYPAGFALLVMTLEPLVGWRHAGDLVIILHSLAGVVATYGLGRVLGLGRRGSALGALIVAASPLYLFMSLQAMSDVPSLAWTTAAVIAALKSRERAPWALASGAAVAVDVLLRPTNALAFLPLAIALGASPRRWVLFVLGGLPGAVFFCAHSLAAYGSLVATGYGDTAFAFLAAYVPGTLLHYAVWLPVLFTPVVVLALGLPCLREAGRPTRWLLGTWILAYAAFYSPYENTHETWWYLRFLLPAAPALVVGGLLVLRALLARLQGGSGRVRSPAVFAAALALVVGSSAWWTNDLRVFPAARDELRYGRAAEWMQDHVPRDAVCLAMQESGALFYYTRFTFLRWDALGPENVGRIEALVRNSGRPLYAVLFPFELAEADVLGKVMPGHWRQVGAVEDVTIWRRDFGAAGPPPP
jgi:hypothetical protein